MAKMLVKVNTDINGIHSTMAKLISTVEHHDDTFNLNRLDDVLNDLTQECDGSDEESLKQLSNNLHVRITAREKGKLVRLFKLKNTHSNLVVICRTYTLVAAWTKNNDLYIYYIGRHGTIVPLFKDKLGLDLDDLIGVPEVVRGYFNAYGTARYPFGELGRVILPRREKSVEVKPFEY